MEGNEKGEIFLHPRKYIDESFEQFPASRGHEISMPMDPKHCLSHEQSPTAQADKRAMAPFPYREAVGSSMYLKVCTRAHIVVVMSRVNKFMASPGRAHSEAEEHLLKYLNGAKKAVFSENCTRR